MKKISIISILAVGAIGVGVYFIYKKNKANAAAKKAAAAATAAAPGAGPGAATGTPNPAGVVTTGTGQNWKILTAQEQAQILQKGSRGDLVKVLQVYLNDRAGMFGTRLLVDGDFGGQTETALARELNGAIRTDLSSLGIDAYYLATYKPLEIWLGIPREI